MATKDFSKLGTDTRVDVVTWAGMQVGDDGAPYPWAHLADRSVQVAGTFGAGGSLVIEGSNDGINYAVLNDPQGLPLAITAGKIEMVMEITRYIRPRVTAGDGSTNLTVSMLVRS